MTIYRSPHPPLALARVSFTEFIFEHFDARANAPAFIEGATGRVVTYGEVRALARRVAVALHREGLAKGDVIAIYSPNVPEYAGVLHGAAQSGIVSTTANPMYSAHELRRQLVDSGARILFTVGALVEKAVAAAEGTRVSRIVTIAGDATGAATPLAAFAGDDGEPPAVTIDPERDVLVLPYSSGTTGLPKGVMLTHANLVHNVMQGEFIERDTPAGRTVGVLPMFHMYGMYIFLGVRLRLGRCTVTMAQFDLPTFARLASEHRATHLYVVPPILLALARHPCVGDHDLSSLAVVTVGAAPVSAVIAQEVTLRLGVTVRQAYGMTELSPAVSAGPAVRERAQPESAGQLVPNTEARFVDPQTLRDVPAGEPGELWVRGPQVMRGYLGREDATMECLTSDGWLRTGDVGRIGADGYLYITDRLKEFIKVNAYQVAPAELEALLLTHPGVADVAVIPVADERTGEAPKAYVVKRGEVDGDALMAFVAERAAPYKKVRQVEFIDAIPKSPSGKILRRELVARERAKAAPPSGAATASPSP